ncbi:hypothetical protein EJB05_51817, partial [Eragrostis curvula]
MGFCRHRHNSTRRECEQRQKQHLRKELCPGLICSSNCDISINISNVMPLGDHQRQNAVTASCTALCLRNLGWDISEPSIQAGLEETQLPGRSQFLTQEEASVLGLNGSSTVLIDGAHTEASAKALSDVIETVKPEGPLALVVGMASDKEHLAFAEQLLSEVCELKTTVLFSEFSASPLPDIVLLTEASIAGGNSRTMPASSLKELWIAAAQDQGIDHMDIGTVSGMETPECIGNLASSSSSSGKCMLIGCQDAPFSRGLIKVASQLLESRGADGAAPGLICVTGSLHLVASVLQHLEQQ